MRRVVPMPMLAVVCVTALVASCQPKAKYTSGQLDCLDALLPSQTVLDIMILDGWPESYPEFQVRVGMRVRAECENVDCVALAEERHGPLNALVGREAQEELIPVCWSEGLPSQWSLVRSVP